MPYVLVDGLRLHYLAQGFGPVVVLIHGLGSCAEDWALLQAPALSQRYRVLMPDLRGHGRSDKPPGPYTVPQMADDIAGFLNALGTDSAHVIGLSLGGAVAQALAVRHPERVRSLVLVNTLGLGGVANDDNPHRGLVGEPGASRPAGGGGTFPPTGPGGVTAGCLPAPLCQ